MMSKFAAIPSFSEIISQIGESICVIGPAGHWVYVNPTFSRFIGIRDEEVYNHAFVDYIHPEDKDEFARVLEILKSGSDIAELRYRLIHRDGVDVWISSVITAVRDNSRQTQYYVVTGRKVGGEKGETPGVTKQAALPGAPDIPFESLIDLMAIPVWVIDTSRLFIFTNPAFNLLVGYPREELVSQNLTGFIDADNKENLDKAIKSLIEGEELAEISLFLKHRSGTQVPVQFLIKPVRSVEGGIAYFIGSNREQGTLLPGSALPDPSAPYRAALERIGVPAWLMDAKGNWIFLNRPFCSVLGLKQSEQPSGGLATMVHVDDLSLIRNALSDLKRTDVVNLSCRVQAGSGRLYWMNITLSAIRTDGEALTYVLAAAHDLTNERMLESRVSQLSARLQDVVDHMEDATIAIDKLGKVRTINAKVLDVLDRLEYEILEQDLIALFPETYADVITGAITKVMANESVSVTVEVERADGRHPLTVKFLPLTYEGESDGALILLKLLTQ